MQRTYLTSLIRSTLKNLCGIIGDLTSAILISQTTVSFTDTFC